MESMNVKVLTKRSRTVLTVLLLAVAMLGSIHGVSAQNPGAELDIPDVITADPNGQVTVPINFISNGNEITAAAFSVDFDEVCLTYDAESNISTVFSLPTGFQPTAMFDPDDIDGELDIVIFQISLAPSPMPDGTIATITFTACNATTPNVVIAPIGFSTDPIATFTDANSQDVPGTADGGKVVVVPAGVVFNADLAVTKVDKTDPVRAGGTITYTVTVTNNGPLDATNVTLVDDLPAEATFVSSSPGVPTCTLVGAQLTCDLGTITNGGSADVVIVLSTTNPTDATLTNTATVSSGDIPDDTPANNTVSITTTVTTSENVPSLSEWGLIGMAGLLVVVFTWRMGLVRRRVTRQVIRKD